MTGSRHAIVLGIGLFALALAGAARAQDLSAGKTPAQLFHLNCAICHKSARGLAAAGASKGGFSGLEGFLAEHYTSDGHSAQVLAAYLKSVGGAAPAARSTHHHPAANRVNRSGASETAKKTKDKKTDMADKAKAGAGKKTDESAAKPKSAKPKSAKPETAKPEADEPAVPAQKPAAAGPDKTAGKKEPAASSGQGKSSQAKDEKPMAAQKKTD